MAYQDDNLNIRIAWAINCAVEMVKASEVDKKVKLEQWTQYFLNLFEEKRSQILNRGKKSMDVGRNSAELDVGED